MQSVSFRCPLDLLHEVDDYVRYTNLDRTKFLIIALHVFVKVYRKRGRRITPRSKRLFARPELNYIKQKIRKEKEKQEKLQALEQEQAQEQD